MEEKAKLEVEKENIQNLVKDQLTNMKEEFAEAREKQMAETKANQEERRKLESRVIELETENSTIMAERALLERQRNEALEKQSMQAQAHHETTGSKLNQTIEQVLQL